MIYFIYLVFLCLVLDQSAAIRCFQCRSDEQPDCGDERFNPNRVEYQECDHFFTQSTLACFKTKQYAAGHTIVIRGCAPFTSEAFSPEMARSIGGNYWKKSNVISFCTYNQCNGGTQPNLTFSAVFISILLAFAGSHL